MIRGIRFCINHSSKISKLGLVDARFDFTAGYNALIGPNGSGKSSVLKAIASCTLCKLERTDDDHIQYITTETLNPLVSGMFASREEMVQGIRSMFLSHGKGVLDSFRNQRHAKQTVVLIDSLETGQDHDNSEFIHEGLLKMSEQYQVIVATNSLVFMRGGNLIDLGENSLRSLIESTGRLTGSLGFSADNGGISQRTPRGGDSSGKTFHNRAIYRKRKRSPTNGPYSPNRFGTDRFA